MKRKKVAKAVILLIVAVFAAPLLMYAYIYVTTPQRGSEAVRGRYEMNKLMQEYETITITGNEFKAVDHNGNIVMGCLGRSCK